MRILITSREDHIGPNAQRTVECDEAYCAWAKTVFGSDCQVDIVDSSFEMEPPMDTDLIILSGGGTVPNEYRVSPTDEYQQIGRDRLEQRLIKFALAESIKVLGICRGMQFINGFFGGKVGVVVPPHSKPGVDHEITLTDGRELWVNSYHNDGIFEQWLAPNLVVAASAACGENRLIEAFKSRDDLFFGVEWHPERTMPKQADQKLINDMIRRWFYEERI